MKSSGILAAAAALGYGVVVRPNHHTRTTYPAGWRQYRRAGHDLPHQGEREIARRLRQAERDEQRQIARGNEWPNYGLQEQRISRRGRVLA